MASNLERRLGTLESRRDDKRKPWEMTDAELVDLIHGRRVTPEERAAYMREFEAEADARHAIRKAESEAKWDAINKARILEAAQRGEQKLKVNATNRGNHVNAD